MSAAANACPTGGRREGLDRGASVVGAAGVTGVVGLAVEIELLLLRHAEDVDSETIATLSRETSPPEAAGPSSGPGVGVAGAEDRSPGSIRPGKRPARCFAADPLLPGPRDPVLTERGLQSLVTGLDAAEMQHAGPSNEGLAGGLHCKVAAFNPDVIYSSPLRRALASAVAVAPAGTAVVASAGLTEIMRDKKGQQKPGSTGHSVVELRSSIAAWGNGFAEPGRIDLAGLPDLDGAGSWNDVDEAVDTAVGRVARFFRELAVTPGIRRAVIATHGGVLKRMPLFEDDDDPPGGPVSPPGSGGEAVSVVSAGSPVVAGGRTLYLAHAKCLRARLRRDGKIILDYGNPDSHIVWKSAKAANPNY